jgi:hypothetical protein
MVLHLSESSERSIRVAKEFIDDVNPNRLSSDKIQVVGPTYEFRKYLLY